MGTETWRPVVGWESLYLVSDYGRVWSIGKARVICAVVNPASGYLQVRLSLGKRRVTYTVHRLVLEAFAGPRPPGHEARHGTGGIHDNRWPGNLRWGTPAENTADKWRDGTMPARLTAAQVREIRARCAAGETHRAVAQVFGVSKATITYAVRRRTWAHVT